MKPIDPERRVAVWIAMANHFLDTETRQDIPRTAEACVAAGLAPEEAARVWMYEVSPAVAFNLWDVAGEWAGWDRDWLVDRIERLRAGWGQRPGTCRWLRYRIAVHFQHGVLVSIERCMKLLRGVESEAARHELRDDLCVLAGHYFDFLPRRLATLDAARRARIQEAYPDPFRNLMAPVLFSDEAAAANRRVLAAFEDA